MKRRVRKCPDCVRVIQVEHRASGQVGPLRLDVFARGRRGGEEVHHRNAVHDREDAAMAAEHAVENLVGFATMVERFDEFESAAAVGAAEEFEGPGVHDP